MTNDNPRHDWLAPHLFSIKRWALCALSRKGAGLATAAQCFLYAATASLLLRRNDLAWPIRRLFELFSVGALSATIFWLLTRRLWHQLASVTQLLWKPYALILGGMVIATASGALWLNIALDREGVLNFGRLLLVMIVAALIIIHGRHNQLFAKRLPWAFLVNLIFLPTLWINMQTLEAWHIVAGRFNGFENFPSNASYLFLIVLAYAWWQVARHWPQRVLVAIPWLGAATTAMAFIWWSNSRASWLATIIIIATVLARHQKNGLPIIQLTTMAIVTLVISYQLLPPDTKMIAVARLWYPRSNVTNQSTPQLDGYDQQPRLYAWQYYSRLTLRQPLGVGVSYFYSPTVARFEQKPIGPHNTPLEILTNGGIITLAGFLWLWWLALNSIEGLALNKPFIQAAIIGLIIASLFDNMIAHKAMWVVLALALI